METIGPPLDLFSRFTPSTTQRRTVVHHSTAHQLNPWLCNQTKFEEVTNNLPFPDPIFSSMTTFLNREALQVFLKTKCKFGKITIAEANQALDYMIQLNPRPPISSFNHLLGSIVKIKHFTDAISCYKRICFIGLVPDFITLNIVQNSCCYVSSSLGFSVFGLILKKGHTPNVVTFTSLIKGLCMEGRIVEAIKLLKRMEELNCRPNMTTYGTLIKGLCGTKNLNVAVKLHREIVKGSANARLKENLISYTTLIDGLCKFGIVDKAKELIFEMESKGISADVVSYTSLIDGLCHTGNSEEARALFDQMLQKGIYPNKFTFNVLINHYCKEGLLEKGKELLQTMIDRGETPDACIYNTLMDGLCMKGQVDDARDIFDLMESYGCSRDATSYSVLINGYCKRWKIGKAVDLYKDMIHRQIPSTIVVMNTLLKALLHHGKVDEAESLYYKESNGGSLKPDIWTYTILLDGLCMNQRVEEALELFYSFERNGIRCVSLYNCIIGGLCKAGMVEKGKNVFDQMYSAGLNPNCITFSAMIRGLCMAGRLEEAYCLLFEMEEKGVCPTVSMFNRVMRGFALKKENSRVMDLFRRMKEKEIVPNASTSTLVLSVMLEDQNHREYFPNVSSPEEIKEEM